MIIYHPGTEHTPEQVLRLERACFPQSLRWDLATLDMMLQKERARTFSAVAGGGLVGWCITVDYAGLYLPPAANGVERTASGVAYVASIAVHPRLQRQGIGRDLLRMAIQASRDAEEIAMAAHCRNAASLALFRHCLPDGLETPCKLGTRFVASYAVTFKNDDENEG